MKTWQKAGIITLITLAIGSIYLFVVFQQRKSRRHRPETRSNRRTPTTTLSCAPNSPPLSTIKLENTAVRMKNGYTMTTPYDSGRIVFTKPVGVYPQFVPSRLDSRKSSRPRRPPPSRRLCSGRRLRHLRHTQDRVMMSVIIHSARSNSPD